ncbi:hypothetical protein BU24DRAFT_428058 [Aaosphaeria arxii CBS 175.79]|uniref:ATPase synthesis protein 25 n=1 Tax=Aaosphaeria arxii CBS 175.79 TaxID=1450172 RepID=A0A6A5XB54_9PLEO|nr:uncharacterized protein BU24DRAFT_428058 [Aaosphaeria arxii CBS 175.79]KAF2010027.1 hypothetical protein BU24DRAFT_428058 [Aaosphaeria arxii CBS 175.79]
MPLIRALPASLRCHGCRSAIVRSFISPTTSNASPSHVSLVVASHRLPQSRAFASGRRLNNEQDALTTSQKEDSASTTTDTVVESASPAAAPLPWYLQNQFQPKKGRDEIDDRHRQAIPELPHNPPPLLQAILEYVSITAGLDDLNLLDLRHLDPPPALGPKLIMIVGTARSEKHLHVSADRFCRWLRREHNLKANAAGLLGRNELKIKLRRKMKRMKMLANVGGKEPEGMIDDGIRTGWICCTIGKIEAHPEDTEMPGDDVDNFVGFRDVKPGVNVVVQMFTEEKRDEIDLETLWGGVLRTHDRKITEAEEKLLKEQEEEGEGEESDIQSDVSPPKPHLSNSASSRPPSDPFPSIEPSTRQWHRPAPTKGDPFPEAPIRNSGQQYRRLHTVGLRSNALS